MLSSRDNLYKQVTKFKLPEVSVTPKRVIQKLNYWQIVESWENVALLSQAKSALFAQSHGAFFTLGLLIDFAD